MKSTRRSFVLGSAAATFGLSLAGRGDRARAVAPSDRIGLGVIGCNGMGFTDLGSMLRVPEATCVALCDVDDRVLQRRATEVQESYGVRPRTYADYRALLDDAEVDAVIVATPDHWHCLQTVHACEAGKDVYVEKPLANSVEECRVLVDAVRRHDRVVQVGQWQRSGRHWAEATDFVRSGGLGRVRTVRAWAYMGWMKSVPRRPDGPPPPGVDYDMWLGPAPRRDFNPNRFHFNFRWYWDYAGGLMTDWGVHLLDVVLWGMNAGYPRRIVSSGGKFAYPDSAMETPDTQQAIYEFEGFSMVWEHAVGIGLGPFQRDHGVAFVGNNGTLVVDRGGWEVLPESEHVDGERRERMEGRRRQIVALDQRGLDQHTKDFVDCVRSRSRPRCDVETAARVAATAHLGNVALRTGDALEWSEARGRFVGHSEANRYLAPTYRKPWKLPETLGKAG
ncbi:MAG: Gfo/Idh/MocA family oxidoreductase [Thermoanaerobaculia bacterium]|nr:Gfo/Idh/MocA family oxidoreductase [Thermoanaerobaculia bacterium]